MGKQRKKKKTSSKKVKAARKAEIQERRERALEWSETQEYKSGVQNLSARVTSLPGDRVWFYDKVNEALSVRDEKDPNTYRGILRSKGERDSVYDFCICQVQPLSNYLNGDPSTLSIPESNILRDHDLLTTQYKVGDEVVCDSNSDMGWLPATITHLWPIWKIKKTQHHMPCYELMCHPSKAGLNASSFPVVVYHDDDDYIQKRPVKFRFKVGDKVVFDPDKAASFRPPVKGWISGEVVEVDVLKDVNDYFSYECATKSNGMYLIWKDDDEHIGTADKNKVRDRFLDSIEQGCSFSHLDFLVQSFGIDLSPIFDLVLERALQYGSFEALHWLEERMELSLKSHRFTDGSTILHRMAASPHAERFFSGLAAYSGSEELFDLSEAVVVKINGKSQNWLQRLMLSGNLRAMEVVLSLDGKLFWKYGIGLRYKNSEQKYDCGKNNVASLILEEYLIHYTLNRQKGFLEYICGTEQEQDLHERPFMKPLFKKGFGVWKFIRFIRQWEDKFESYTSIASIMKNIGGHGFANLFSLFFKVDNSVVDMGSEEVYFYPGVTHNEFVQPELREKSDRFDSERVLNIMTVVVNGDERLRPDMSKVSPERDWYWVIKNTPITDFDSLIAYFEQERKDCEKNTYGVYEEERRYKYQLELLQDDNTVPGRLLILESLINGEGWSPPSILDPIRMRQGGIFEFLIRLSSTKLDESALLHRDLTSPLARRLKFLDGRRVPKACSVGCFLAFACVEMDSLRILVYLVEEKNVTITDFVLGFNLLHLCAYFGRVEIIVWLHTRPEWGEMLHDLASRRGFEQNTAAHVAVQQGHTIVADLLLKLGCSAVDGNKKSINAIATASSYEHVREWRREKAFPFRLQEKVERLLKLLEIQDYESAKTHITISKCLDIKEWESAGLYIDDPLPSGITYRMTILKSVENADENFDLWLCHELTTRDKARQHSRNIFWQKPNLQQKYLCPSDLKDIFTSHNLEELVQWLSKSWASEVEVYDPVDTNPILCGNILNEDRSKKFRIEALVIKVYYGLLQALGRYSRRQIAQGVSSDTVVELYRSFRNIAERLAEVHKADLKELISYYSVFTYDEDKFINMDSKLYSVKYAQTHAAFSHLPMANESLHGISSIHRVLAIENHYHLILLSHERGAFWTAPMELEVIRISAFFSHGEVVDYFLNGNSDIFLAPLEQRYRAAMLGAAETGRTDYWIQLMAKSERVNDSLVNEFLHAEDSEQQKDYDEKRLDEERAQNQVEVVASLPATIAYGYINSGIEGTAKKFSSLENYEAILKKLIENFGYEASTFLYAISKLAEAFLLMEPSVWESSMRFTNLLYSSYGLNPFEATTRKIVDKFTGQIVEHALYEGKEGKDNQERMSLVACRWLQMIASWGINLESLRNHSLERVSARKKGNETATAIKHELQNLKKQQRDQWAKLDIIKQGLPLQEIQEAVESDSLSLRAADKGGLRAVHLAAAYNRVDVLQWLVETKNVDIEQKDFLSRNVLDIARASKANDTTLWLEERRAKNVIANFLRKYFLKCLAQRRKARLLAGVKRFQARYRGILARKRHRGTLMLVVEESQRFRTVWKEAETSMVHSDMKSFCWSSFRDLRQSIVVDNGDIEGLLETEERLGAAMERALEEDTDHSDEFDDEVTSEISAMSDAKAQCVPDKECGISDKTAIRLSSDVVKWLRQADMKYREFFVRRVEQLQNGDRSRILAKRLRGSQSTIFETYLEQKSGHRILWQEESNQSILIWYVAKHKHVSRLMRLIDDSDNRSTRQRVDASSIPELDTGIEDTQASAQANSRVMLNPRGNVPLKIYQVQPDSITDVLNESWSPQLYLSEEERSIVEASGTILLLGRSGTGKTVCICNRMDIDRQRHQYSNSFSQLFVARSQRLARYVSETVGSHERSTFTTFGELLHQLEAELPDVDCTPSIFLPSQKMDFSRFKRDVCRENTGQKGNQYIDPMIAWTNIRSFIKGSIEALSSADQILDREAFLQLGKKRCRLNQTDRQKVYEVFLHYQKVLTEQGLWDDNDRISSLLQRLMLLQNSDHESFQRIRRSKIYVDEIQDYTQNEILLFFRLCGPGNLFLAGDPAQSVVEGVEFRFEEIRSVGYFVAGPERRDLIPDKPKKVTVNFRSHSGVLNTAAAVLRRLFDNFPDSAKELAEDRGVFTGPRPGVFHNIHVEKLKCLVSEKLNGIVVLTHDENVSYWKRALGNYPLVHGIRGAKGLEFKRVIIVGFFAETTKDLQKPWRDLLLGRETCKQELEAKLKLLYTAVTRCIERLFFAETSRSIAGDAFVRWATTSSVRPEVLATRQNIDNVETMALTQDEWIASGLENAEVGESHAATNLEESISMLEKAIFCFEQGKDDDLARKARTHKASLLFRQGLGDGSIQWSDGNAEFSSALLVEQLASENLLLEARRLLELSVMPHMGPYTQDQMKKNVLSKFPFDENSMLYS